MAVDTIPLAAKRLAVKGVVEDGTAGDGRGKGVGAAEGDRGRRVLIWDRGAGDGGCWLGGCIGWGFEGLEEGAKFGFGELVAGEGFCGLRWRQLRKWLLLCFGKGDAGSWVRSCRRCISRRLIGSIGGWGRAP